MVNCEASGGGLSIHSVQINDQMGLLKGKPKPKTADENQDRKEHVVSRLVSVPPGTHVSCCRII